MSSVGIKDRMDLMGLIGAIGCIIALAGGILFDSSTPGFLDTVSLVLLGLTALVSIATPVASLRMRNGAFTIATIVLAIVSLIYITIVFMDNVELYPDIDVTFWSCYIGLMLAISFNGMKFIKA